MESTLHSSDDARLRALRAWLSTLPSDLQLNLTTLAPASSDASFRRYYRLASAQGTVIVMDAPPPQEDCRPFVNVTHVLAEAGLNVPEIIAENVESGFLLLSDLGRHTYYHAIESGLDDTRLQTLYREALGALVRMQHATSSSLPRYDSERLSQELTVFPDWYIDRHCGATLNSEEQEALQTVFALLVEDAASQPTVFVHRDFHSPNIMVGPADQNPGIIDYQDAVAGPITYDIASLVMDARTTWEEAQQLDWAIRYWEAARATGLPVAADFAEFHRAYEWMSLQRNLRILGVFARLAHRDQKPQYLDHIPRVLTYVRQVASRYGSFRSLLRLLDRLEDRDIRIGYTF